MKITIKFRPLSDEVVDLTHFGHSKTTKWEDLTEEEQDVVLDSVRQNFKDNYELYIDEICTD